MKNGNWVYGESMYGKWYSGSFEEGYDDKEFAITEGLEFSLNTNNDFVFIGQVQDDSVINKEQIEVSSLLDGVITEEEFTAKKEILEI